MSCSIQSSSYGWNNVVRGATTPDGFRQLVSDEIKKLSQIAVAAGISLD